MFCLVFSVANPLLQPSPVNWTEEFERQLFDGTLVLRISTIIFTGALLWKAIKYLQPREEQPEFLKDLHALPTHLIDRDRRLRDVAQSGIFVSALLALWILSALDITNKLTTFLAFCFAFFADDWLIISDYSRSLKGRVLKWHTVRLAVANVLLIVLLAVVTWQEFHGFGLAVWYLISAMLLLTRYAFERIGGLIIVPWPRR